MHPRAEHVWVTDVQTWGDGRAPGLLIGWQQDRTGAWLGWVVVAHLGAQDSGPYVQQRWVRAESILRRDR
jgi:hypothetical protein